MGCKSDMQLLMRRRVVEGRFSRIFGTESNACARAGCVYGEGAEGGSREGEVLRAPAFTWPKTGSCGRFPPDA